MTQTQQRKISSLIREACEAGNHRAGDRLHDIMTGLGSDALQRVYVAMKDPQMESVMIKAAEILMRR